MSRRNGPRRVAGPDIRGFGDLSNRTHGLRATYNAGCQCGPCTDADRDYQRDRYDSRRLDTVNIAEFDLSWQSDAACRGLDPNLFFPTRGEPEHTGRHNPARLVCAACPVRAECLTYALDAREIHGTWGGYSEKQRRRLRRDPAARALALLRIAKGTAA